MRSTRVIKYAVFLMLSNGAAISGAQASNLTNEMSGIGASCEQSTSQLAIAADAQADSPAGGSNSGGSPVSNVGHYLKNTPAAQLGELIQSASGAVAAVNTSACDGLMAQVAADKSVVDLDTQSRVLGGGMETDIHQPTAVPLSAAAWLFSSALLGFIVVANRRKV
jgi:pectate lyase